MCLCSCTLCEGIHAQVTSQGGGGLGKHGLEWGWGGVACIGNAMGASGGGEWSPSGAEWGGAGEGSGNSKTTWAEWGRVGGWAGWVGLGMHWDAIEQH